MSGQVVRSVGVYVVKSGGGGDRSRPFIIIVIWAGFVLAENRGNTVTRAYISSSIDTMHPYWGF